MTKEEYKAEMTRIEKEERELFRLKLQTKDDYIKEHAEYQEGDKVRVVGEEWNGKKVDAILFVGSPNTHDDGSMYYRFWKSKADGTRSSFRYRGIDKITSIELIEKAQ